MTEKKTDTDEWAKKQKLLSQIDAKNAELRPWVVKWLTIATVFFIMFYAITMLVVAWKKGDASTTLPSYEALAVILGIPTIAITNYFKRRSDDKQGRINGALGAPTNTNGIVGKVVDKLSN